VCGSNIALRTPEVIAMSARFVVALTLGVSAALLGPARSAEAILIDFTNAAAWAGANGTTIYSSPTLFDGVTVTVTSQGPSGLLTFNSGGDVNPTCGAITGLSCGGDGLGVSDDEVTVGAGLLDPNLERLYVYFNAPVNVNSIGFLDLFGRNSLTGDTAAETARWIVLASGEEGSLTGTDTTTRLGYATTATNYSNVTALLFYAAGPTSSANTDFALASLDVSRSSIPEPATLMLLGLGLVTASFVRRRCS
jgi:hypothetical protein